MEDEGEVFCDPFAETTASAIINYQLENSEEQLKQFPDSYKVIIIAAMAHSK